MPHYSYKRGISLKIGAKISKRGIKNGEFISKNGKIALLQNTPVNLASKTAVITTVENFFTAPTGIIAGRRFHYTHHWLIWARKTEELFYTYLYTVIYLEKFII